MTNPTSPPLSKTSSSSPLSVPPTATALLLLDFHTFLLSSIPSEPCLQTAISLTTWARHSNIQPIHCLVDFTTLVPSALKPATRFKDLQAKIANEADPDGYVSEHSDLRPAIGEEELVFRRPLGKTSVLSSPGLKEVLTGKGVRSVIVCGIATSGCVIDSAKALVEAGFVVTIVQDACADREVEVHEFVMGRLMGRQCHVVRFEELREAWDEK